MVTPLLTKLIYDDDVFYAEYFETLPVVVIVEALWLQALI